MSERLCDRVRKELDKMPRIDNPYPYEAWKPGRPTKMARFIRSMHIQWNWEMFGKYGFAGALVNAKPVGFITDANNKILIKYEPRAI